MKYCDRIHPFAFLIYFLFVVFVTMFTLNPIIICGSFLFAVTFYGLLVGAKKLFSSLCYTLPLMLIIALINPIFVHKGQTVLFFLNDNPFTMEALVYGVCSSVMIASVLYWFKSFNVIMTGEKTAVLFWRVLPKISLIITMALRFIPDFKRKYREIDDAQKALGVYSSKSFVDRVSAKLRVVSVLVSASVEDSVTTAESMSARGYGLKGRRVFSPYGWGIDEVALTLPCLVLGGASLYCLITGVVGFYYYPTVKRLSFGALQWTVYGIIWALFALTTFFEVKDGIKWRLLKSKI